MKPKIIFKTLYRNFRKQKNDFDTRSDIADIFAIRHKRESYELYDMGTGLSMVYMPVSARFLYHKIKENRLRKN